MDNMNQCDALHYTEQKCGQYESMRRITLHGAEM